MLKKGKFDRGVTFSWRTPVILLLIALLLIVGGIALGLHWSRLSGMEESLPGGSFIPDSDPGAKDWSQEALPDKSGGESTGIKIPGYPFITLPANTEDVTVALLNPEGNPCYFTFTLVLRDTDEVLYTSGMVAPGQVITDITLSRPLEAGEYNADIQISTASLTDGSAMNGANVETVLMVQ